MKLLRYYPYFVAFGFSIIMYYLIAIDLVHVEGRILIFFPTLIFTFIIARFYHLNFYKSFFVSLSFFIIGAFFLFFVINYTSPYALTLHNLAFPVFLGASIVGIIIGLIVEKRGK